MSEEKTYTYGYKFSDQTRKRMSEAKLGKRHTPEHIQKVREAKLGMKYNIDLTPPMEVFSLENPTKEEVLNIYNLLEKEKKELKPEKKKPKEKPEKEKPEKVKKSKREFSLEHRRKISESKKGSKHPLYGKKHSEETKRKIREYWINKRKVKNGYNI